GAQGGGGNGPVQRAGAPKEKGGDPASTARPDSQGSDGQATHGAEAADKEGEGDVCQAQRDHRADLWPVETGAGIPPVLAARPGVDARRMAADVHGAQPAEAVATRSRGGDGVMGPATV